VGAKLVLPGPYLDGKSVSELLVKEKVTFTCGVPTVWTNLFDYIDREARDLKLPSLERVVCGGTAMPRSMIKRFILQFKTQVIHIWGMTEMSPIGTVGKLLPKHEELSLEDKLDVMVKQGRVTFGVEMKIVGDGGKEMPRDGKSFGDLYVRGPWVLRRYYRGENEAVDKDGWFLTGDVATIDEDGYMQITDRSKDVIKSGGEWISSIDLENACVAHPGVLEAAVVGVPHPKWDERPLLVIVQKKDSNVTKDDILQFLESRVAKWWLPDDVVFVDKIPYTATGKVSKLTLRDMFKNHKLPEVVRLRARF